MVVDVFDVDVFDVVVVVVVVVVDVVAVFDVVVVAAFAGVSNARKPCSSPFSSSPVAEKDLRKADEENKRRCRSG